MKTIMLIISFIFSFTAFTQRWNGLVIGLTDQYTSYIFFYKGFPTMKFSLNVGTQLDLKDKVALELGFGYHFETNVNAIKYGDYSYTIGENIVHSKRLSFQEQLISLYAKARFVTMAKRFIPYLKIELYQNIHSNYRNKFMTSAENDHLPIQRLYVMNGPRIQNSNDFYGDIYQSTPFIGSFSIGYDIKLFKGFYIEAGVGYCVRVMKTQFNKWTGTPDYNQTHVKQFPTETSIFQMPTFQLGCNYLIPFKIKKHLKADIPIQ